MERQEFLCERSPYQTHKNLIRYNHKVISANDCQSKEVAKFGECSHHNQDTLIHIDNYISTENNITTNGVDAILTDSIQPKCDDYLTPRSSIGLRSPVPFHDENVSFVICSSLDNCTATMINTILPLTIRNSVFHPVANFSICSSVTLARLTKGHSKKPCLEL